MSNVFADFLLNKGLYDKIEINKDNIQDLIDLIGGKDKIDCYCKECKQMRVFTMEPIQFISYIENSNGGSFFDLADNLSELQNAINLKPKYAGKDNFIWKRSFLDEQTRLLTFNFTCTMAEEHHLDFIVLTTNDSMMKIGQYPSVADLTFPELDEYKKVLSTENRDEFGRAIGLYASGIGAGSYVYLRRIFERILQEAKNNATGIDEDEFARARVNEKITILKDYLPEMLTSNTLIYGILSKGIHELSEEECKKYFPVLKDCIYMILNQWEKDRKDKEERENIEKQLSKIAEDIK